MTVDIAMLSEAQRRVITTAIPRGRITATGEPVCFEAWGRFRRTLDSLRASGLIEGRYLTADGLEARALLLKDNSDAG
jgi:hypothetical protein